MCLSSPSCEFSELSEGDTKNSCDERAQQDFSPKKFVKNVMNKGFKTICDNDTDGLKNNELPPFYNEQMFKRGQAFFHQNIFGMCLGSLLGLMATLSNQSGLAVLIMTKMSSSDYSAYKRYMSTIFHMLIWYDSEFKPGASLWTSLHCVKTKHNCVSKKAATVLQYQINQRDMILAQWGFMGIAVSRPEFVGIYDKSQEKWKCFAHLWKVIGYLLGITEEFNICRDSLEETRAICNEIAIEVLKPQIAKREERYIKMCEHLLNGLWSISPILEFNSFMFYMNATLIKSTESISDQNEEYKKLTWDQKARLQIILFVMDNMRYSIVRVLLRYSQYFTFWLVKHFNCLSWWQFGVKKLKV
ncbi:uncharacterized protein [Euwallacea fornicatus]|uniref:uncharacterized protein n=1 Tax=Euwallacea fornicatus TaxID=995702 RepID=UPI00338E0CE1